MGIGKRILNLLIGLLFIISVTVLGSSFLAKKVLVDAISQAGVDTAISHRMMDAVFGYAGADDTEWISKDTEQDEKNGEVQAITQKVMNEITRRSSSGKAYEERRCNKRTESDFIWMTVCRNPNNPEVT